ncbi:hypothetical protein AK812_SmicGene39498 [Symbiodinium microadriaticum]|uniref:Polycystin-2 n=1 Tax=Symbiodinium microadriaticum TaxID=2951 RepID=A0A1Q9CBD0_SYMMI|nr:hypothetical protein AK812_SmicGene39498 [Symbiodinium microadriaticum]
MTMGRPPRYLVGDTTPATSTSATTASPGLCFALLLGNHVFFDCGVVNSEHLEGFATRRACIYATNVSDASSWGHVGLQVTRLGRDEIMMRLWSSSTKRRLTSTCERFLDLAPSRTVFLCFASAGMVLFGYTVEGFHTFIYSLFFCWRSGVGMDDIDVYEVWYQVLAYFWYFTYLALMSRTLMINILVGLIFEAYGRIHANAGEPPTLLEQVSEAVDTLKDTKSFINMWPACVVSDIGSESVTVRSLKKAFSKDRMTKQNAEYLIENASAFAKKQVDPAVLQCVLFIIPLSQAKKIDLSVSDGVRMIGQARTNTNKLLSLSEQDSRKGKIAFTFGQISRGCYLIPVPAVSLAAAGVNAMLRKFHMKHAEGPREEDWLKTCLGELQQDCIRESPHQTVRSQGSKTFWIPPTGRCNGAEDYLSKEQDAHDIRGVSEGEEGKVLPQLLSSREELLLERMRALTSDLIKKGKDWAKMLTCIEGPALEATCAYVGERVHMPSTEQHRLVDFIDQSIQGRQESIQEKDAWGRQKTVVLTDRCEKIEISIGKLGECLKGVDPTQLRGMPEKLQVVAGKIRGIQQEDSSPTSDHKADSDHMSVLQGQLSNIHEDVETITDQFFLRANAQKLQGAESVKALSRAASCQPSQKFHRQLHQHLISLLTLA